MGVLLEFDEATVSSVHSQRSNNTSLTNHRQGVFQSTTVTGNRAADNAYSSRAVHTALPVERPARWTIDQDNDACPAANSSIGSVGPLQGINPKKSAEQDLHDIPRGAQSSLFSAPSRAPSEDLPGTIDDVDHVGVNQAAQPSAVDQWKNLAITQQGSRLLGDTRELAARKIGKPDNEALPAVQRTHSLPEHIAGSDKSVDFSGVPTSQRDLICSISARARQIFLASKVFNRWADQTALKLEREAIARRHMIRFRCFTGWIRAPESRAPIANHLKAASAVQKLRRAIVCQEEQLQFASSVIAEHHQLSRAKKLFAAWNCRVLSKHANLKSQRLTKVNTTENFLRLAGRESSATRRAEIHFRKASGSRICAAWLLKTDQCKSQSALAEQIATTRHFQQFLGSWWDSTEVKRRATACRDVLTMAKSRKVFEIWNLRARAQAFRWRNEYVSAVKAVQGWSTRTQRYEKESLDSSLHVKGRYANLVLDRLMASCHEQLDLERQASRSRFFLGATRMLQVFDQVSARRRHRMKQVVRRYLMMRYTQVSSKRRRRGFYDAMSRWQLHMSKGSQVSSLADKYSASVDIDRGLAAIADWRAYIELNLESRALAQISWKQHWANNWEKKSMRHMFLHGQARELWATQNQKNRIKSWAISALQQSGQAHTATMVRHRHSRDRRQKAFQRWRLTVYGYEESNTKPEHVVTSAKTLNNIHLSRSLIQGTRPAARGTTGDLELRSPLETPTRSTGISLSAASARPLRPMARVEEIDAESLDSLETEEDAIRWHPRRPNHRPMSVVTELPSTTPQAPVPTYLQRNFTASRLRSSLVRRMANAQAAEVQSSRLESVQNNDYSMVPGSDLQPRRRTYVLSPPHASDATSKSLFVSFNALDSAQQPFARSVPLTTKRWQTVLSDSDSTPHLSQRTPGKRL